MAQGFPLSPADPRLHPAAICEGQRLKEERKLKTGHWSINNTNLDDIQHDLILLTSVPQSVCHNFSDKTPEKVWLKMPFSCNVNHNKILLKDLLNTSQINSRYHEERKNIL